MNQKKIAVVHPDLVAGGGSEAVALWMLESLKDEHDVTLITMGKPDLMMLNKCYGTHIDEDKIRVIHIPSLLKNRFRALRGYRLEKYCKQNASKYDVMISAYNVMDFGKKGIQYINDFSFNDKLRRTLNPSVKGLKGLFYKASPFRSIYLKAGTMLSGISVDGWKKNLSIVNSEWTGKVLKDAFGAESLTIHPPVISKFHKIPWDKREEGFICIGRLVPEKRIDKIIDILKAVRNKGKDIHLHILGRVDNSGYAKELRDLQEKNRGWVFIEGSMYGEEKDRFIAQHKYGISGCKHEAFGIAVAELVKAGCLAWVPNGGGQVEIVNHSSLIYDDVEDAVKKINNVLKNITIQIKLREDLVLQSNILSTEIFQSQIRECVHRYIEKEKMSCSNSK